MVLRFSRGRVGSRLFKVRLKGLTFFVYVYVPEKCTATVYGSLPLKRKCVTHPLNPPPVRGTCYLEDVSRLSHIAMSDFLFMYMYRRVYRHGIWFSDLKEKVCYLSP